MTKVIDMKEVVNEKNDSTLEGTGITNQATSEAPKVDAKDLPEGTMMEITQPGTDKVYTFPALALAGGDFHQVIQASDNTIPEEDIKRYHDKTLDMDWKDGRVHLGGSEFEYTEEIDYEIEQDWVKEIWDKVNPEGVKLIRHYLSTQPDSIHIDSWSGDQYTVIVYLTPDWTPDDGGSIEFWTPNLTDKMRAMAVNTPYGFSGSAEPNIVKSYWPKAGRVVVFDARIPNVSRAVEGDMYKVSLVFNVRKLTESEK